MSDKPAPAPAIGVSLQTDLGGGGVFMLQTHYDAETSPADRSRIHDMIYDDSERMRARVRIGNIGKEISGIKLQMSLNSPQVERAEADYQRKKQERIEKSEMSAQADARRHSEANRRGPYKMSASEAQHQKGLAVEQDREDAERKQLLDGIAATEMQLNQAIERLTAEAASLQVVVDGPYSRADR